MLLTLDFGNSYTKIAVFQNNKILLTERCEQEMLLKKVSELIKKYTISHCIVSEVAAFSRKTNDFLSANTHLTVINAASPIPFTNNYTTPHTLGIDRKTLVAGASLLVTQRNCLIIDAGTCITYDFIDAKNQYWGGSISAGINMRYQALHHFTEKLPLLGMQNTESLIGNTTNNAIHTGVVGGVLYEIDGFIDAYHKQYQDLTVILTGGDAIFLAKNLKNTIFANSNFLLESLNAYHHYILSHV